MQTMTVIKTSVFLTLLKEAKTVILKKIPRQILTQAFKKMVYDET